MKRAKLTAIFIFLLGCALSLLIYVDEERAVRAQKLSQASIDIAELTSKIKRGQEVTKQLLTAISSFFASSEFVSRNEFTNFVTPILKNNPFISAIEWSPVSSLENLPLIEKRMGKRITPFKGREHSSLICPIEYVVPLIGNEGTIGIDLCSDQTRRETLILSEKSGIHSTPFTELVQGGTGTLVFTEAKNSGERGSVIAVLDLKKFLEATLNKAEYEHIRLAIESTGVLQYGEIITSPYTIPGELDFLGQKWKLYWVVDPLYLKDFSFLKGHIASLLVLLFTCFLLWYFLAFSRRRAEIEEIVFKRTGELRESEERYRVLLNTIPNGVITIDEKGIIRFFGTQAENIFGYSSEEATGQNISLLMPSPHKERHDSYIAEYLATGQRKVIGIGREVFARKKNGDIFPIYLAVGEMRIGSRRFFTGVVHDNSIQKKIERDLVDAKENAERALKIKSDFLARMSHEIRTPLNAILGMTHILFESNLSEIQQDYVKTISSSGENLLFILNEILDFSKVEAGKLILEKSPFHLESVLKNIINLMTPLARNKGIDINFEMSGDVPTGMIGDSTRISQVLMNLMGNAIKFTHKGNVLLSVSADKISSERANFKFRIIDTGIGIAPHEAETLFHSFVQADASIGRKYGGTGLGLAISKKIVELMGGEIHIDSKVGVGTTLEFNVVEDFTNSIITPERADEIITKNLSNEIPLHILVVEDNLINQKIVATFLEKMGYVPDLVASGAEAIKDLEFKEYDLILMDLQMPEMDGFETTEKIKTMILKQRPVIIPMTANVFKEDRERCIALGMVDFLPKPIRKSELELIIRRNFSIKDQRVEKIIDARKLKEKFIDERDLLVDICHELFNIASTHLDKIQHDFEMGDLEKLERSAHAFKGVISNFEAERLRALLFEIESASREHDKKRVDLQVPKLHDLYVKFNDELREFLKNF